MTNHFLHKRPPRRLPLQWGWIVGNINSEQSDEAKQKILKYQAMCKRNRRVWNPFHCLLVLL